jgi:hypothetical protein
VSNSAKHILCCVFNQRIIVLHNNYTTLLLVVSMPVPWEALIPFGEFARLFVPFENLAEKRGLT